MFVLKGAALFYEHNPLVGKESVISYALGAHISGTAVVRLYTGDGFIMAADGLRRDLSGVEISNDSKKSSKRKRPEGCLVTP